MCTTSRIGFANCRRAQQGVVFHLIGALSEFGKLGVVAVGDSPEKARQLYEMTVGGLDEECPRE